jgi:tetratricopeptide (TPR) repeat protein
MDRLKKRYALTLALLACGAFAESPETLFKQGNAAYAEGKFTDAVTLYESAHTGGLNHWVLEYNLGNAYSRTEHPGKAITHYFRAFRLNSSAHDVIENLNLVSTKVGDPLLPASGLAVFLWRLFYALSLNMLTFGASLFFFGLCTMSVLQWTERRRFSVEAWALSGLLLAGVSGWLGVRWSLQTRPLGIVTAAVAEVRSGPNLTYPANFTIPEGRRVIVLEEQEPVQGWLEIGVPQEGLKGWVPDSVVDVI